MATQSQQVSPAESLLSAPGDNYTSLFESSSPDNSVATMNPMDIMTPQSYSGDKSDRLSPVAEDEEASGEAGDNDKKPTKKRKSWGQVLPEPKTNLPPRKRAKTDDEKEQRRVERVLRNRRAAQSSRERKRLEVEALEKRNQELELMLLDAQKNNLLLVEELNKFRRDSGVVTRTSTPLESLRDNQISLSPELFSSQDGRPADAANPGNDIVDELIVDSNPTVNPVALSPELAPTKEAVAEPETKEQTATTSPDLTQHSAAMLSDLQCHMSAEVPRSFQESQTLTSPLLAWTLQLRMLLLSASAMISACQRPLTQIAMSSKAGFSLLPTPQLLTTIIWLVTLPPASRINPLRSSTSTTSSATRQTTSPLTLWQRATMPLRTTVSTSSSTTLRLKSLRKILSSSPSLARPLMDATMVALRLVSERGDDQVGNLQRESSGTRDEACELTRCLRGADLPSKEVLLTLLWALRKMEAQQIKNQDGITTVDELACASKEPTTTYILKTKGMKQMRRRGGVTKRYRLA